MITTRPSGIVRRLGYQRPCRMSGWRVQVSFHGLNVRTSFRPFHPCVAVGPVEYWRLPPATTTRPSGSIAWPAHQTLNGRPVAGLIGGLTCFVVPVAGSHSHAWPSLSVYVESG